VIVVSDGLRTLSVQDLEAGLMMRVPVGRVGCVALGAVCGVSCL
jgi:hypothetical protein